MSDALDGPPLWVDTPKARIAYQVLGDTGADPLVLVHGWPLNRRTWRNLVPFLTSRFRVYAIDVPGAGETEWREETDFTWQGQAASLKVFVDTLRISRYYLLGQDSGAAIARMLALIDGPRIVKFAMTNTEIPGHRPPWVRLFRRIFRWPQLGRFSLRSVLSREFSLQSSMGFGGSFNDKTLILGDFRTHVIQPLVADPRRIEGHRRFLLGWNFDLLDQMKDLHRQITMPVLLAWGALDQTFPLTEAEAMRPQFPNARLVAIPDAKLFVHEEQPQRLAAELLAFF